MSGIYQDKTGLFVAKFKKLQENKEEPPHTSYIHYQYQPDSSPIPFHILPQIRDPAVAHEF